MPRWGGIRCGDFLHVGFDAVFAVWGGYGRAGAKLRKQLAGRLAQPDLMRISGDKITSVLGQVGIVGYKLPTGARAGVRQGTFAASRNAAEQHARFSISWRNHAGRVHTDEMYSVERREHQAFQKMMAKPVRPIQHGAADVQAGRESPNRELGAIRGIANQRESIGGSLIDWLSRRWVTLVDVNRQAERGRLEETSACTPTLSRNP